MTPGWRVMRQNVTVWGRWHQSCCDERLFLFSLSFFSPPLPPLPFPVLIKPSSSSDSLALRLPAGQRRSRAHLLEGRRKPPCSSLPPVTKVSSPCQHGGSQCLTSTRRGMLWAETPVLPASPFPGHLERVPRLHPIPSAPLWGQGKHPWRLIALLLWQQGHHTSSRGPAPPQAPFLGARSEHEDWERCMGISGSQRSPPPSRDTQTSPNPGSRPLLSNSPVFQGISLEGTVHPLDQAHAGLQPAVTVPSGACHPCWDRSL